MYRLDIVYLHKFVATQLMYGSVTLARCAALPFSKTLTTTNRDFLSILTVDFPSLLCSSVNLTFGRKRCSESVVVWLLLAFSFPACFLTVDFPSLLRSSVNLTFGRKRCSESVVALLLHLLLPCFYCPAHQVPWEDRKPYNKKKTHPQVCL